METGVKKQSPQAAKKKRSGGSPRKEKSQSAGSVSAQKLSALQQRAKKQLLQQKIRQCDLAKTQTIADLVDAFGGMSIQARNLGGCLRVLEGMYADRKRPTVMLGLAGPLVAAGLRKVIADMIEYRMVDVIVSTGAILYQDFYQARGFEHWKGSPQADDAVLRDLYIDRIYDTYVDEEAFWKTDLWIGEFADAYAGRILSSRAFLVDLAAEAKNDKNSILAAAWRHGVPIFCPALNDSSIGIGLTDHYHRCKQKNVEPLTISSIRDNYEITQIVVKSKATAAIYIAGGVPKNYINDSIVMSSIFGKDRSHSHAIQLTTDVPHWGGLSGSTLEEAKSWGKIDTRATSQMAFVEPSVSLPLLAGAVLQKKLTQKRSRLRFDWQKDVLKKLTIEK
jgi:deoxyhypusine synthase